MALINHRLLKILKQFWLPVIVGLPILCPGNAGAIPQNKADAAHLSFNGQPPADGTGINETVVNGRFAQAKSRFVINAPLEVVWKILTNFPEYPQIFHRLQSCRITRQQGDLIWIESDLKPHVFVHNPRQHTLHDLSGKPYVLDWKLLDGNFKTVLGKWQLHQLSPGDRCEVIYTLSIDPGPIIPRFLISFALKNFQKEVVTSLKNWVESSQSNSSSTI